MAGQKQRSKDVCYYPRIFAVFTCVKRGEIQKKRVQESTKTIIKEKIPRMGGVVKGGPKKHRGEQTRVTLGWRKVYLIKESHWNNLKKGVGGGVGKLQHETVFLN